MSITIKESDWSILRELHEVALDRYCQQVLSDVQARISKAGSTYHERYLKVFDLIRKRDKDLARLFDELKRSNAVFHLSGLKAHALISDEEFSRFSERTRDAVNTTLPIMQT